MRNTKKADVCSSCPAHKWSSVLSSHWEYQTPPPHQFIGFSCQRAALLRETLSEGEADPQPAKCYEGRGWCLITETQRNVCTSDGDSAHARPHDSRGHICLYIDLQEIKSSMRRGLARELLLVTNCVRTWLHAVHLWTFPVYVMSKRCPDQSLFRQMQVFP